MSKLALIMIAAIAPMAGIAAPAAAEDNERPRVAVRYDDLDLLSVAGRQQLETRVQVAIRHMCRNEPQRELWQRTAAAECERAAKRSAEPQLAALTNGNGARFGDRPPVAAGP